MDRRLRLGFACAWWHPRESTWSYTPVSLLRALNRENSIDITPIDAQLPFPAKAAIGLVYSGMSKSLWKYGRLNRWHMHYKIQHEARTAGCDAVLAMADADVLVEQPTFFYQDMSLGIALAHSESFGPRVPNLPALSRRHLEVCATQQRGRYKQSAGVLTMGKWFADWLVEREEVPPHLVHAVGAGMNAVSRYRRVETDGEMPHRLLFIGRDFYRKGGDLVVDAVAMLRASGDGPYRLTVVGPPAWPLKGAPPPWVDFRGPMPPAGVGSLWAMHDVFVLPSWFEAYGLAFLEARAGGLPCIARRAYAMPELVPDGRAGVLVSEEARAEEIAAAIHSVCNNGELFQRVAKEADEVVRTNSWATVASRTVAIVRETIG